MHTLAVCMECQVNDGFPNFESLQTSLIPDDGTMHITCNKGHKTLQVLSQPKHELLAELSMSAIRDGYYREGVVSFAAALESLYRFYVRVVLLTNGTDVEAFSRTWNSLSKLSERQYGAFVFVYLAETGGAYQPMQQAQVQFRNNVVHHGIIPTFEQALKYCQVVADCAYPVLCQLENEKYQAVKRDVILSISEKARRLASEAGTVISGGEISTPLRLQSDQKSINIEKYLANLQNWDVRKVLAEIAEVAPFLNKALVEAKNKGPLKP